MFFFCYVCDNKKQATFKFEPREEEILEGIITITRDEHGNRNFAIDYFITAQGKYNKFALDTYGNIKKKLERGLAVTVINDSEIESRPHGI
ncbi:MAG: hypothetical protein LBP36_03160 [Oscillospiraceae bacterium]|nr:hypothetical protein [Oscillospiraceae bacterium]